MMSLFLYLLATMMMILPSTQAWMQPPSPQRNKWTTTNTATSSSSAPSLFPSFFSQNQHRSRSNNNNNRKKSVADRTPEETRALFQDILRATLDAGPQAGPLRAWQAYQAVDSTFRDVVLPTLLNQQQQSSSSSSTTIPVLLRTLFERMGATYIKLGQFIASSPTLFPAAYVQEFQKCLDQTDPVPWSSIERILQDELGNGNGNNNTSIDSIFSYIDPIPLASASIAQVHAAQLANGDVDVVIKVQKPRIAPVLQADLSFLYVAARVLEYVQPDWERTSLAQVVGDIRASMLLELDFVQEAENTMEFRRFLEEQQLTAVATAPYVYTEYSTKKVLTMERLDGVSLLNAETVLQQNQSPEDVILTALNTWSLSVVSMPFFHADVHAGNLLLLRDGRVGFIDFGIVGRISPKVLQAVTELSAALALGDTQGMAVALCGMGAADATVDTVQFGKDLERVMERMQTMSVDVSASPASGSASLNVDESEITNLLLELVEVTENNGLKLPREFGLLVKQSLYFDRYLKILAPDIDVMRDDRVQFGGGGGGSLSAAAVV